MLRMQYLGCPQLVGIFTGIRHPPWGPEYQINSILPRYIREPSRQIRRKMQRKRWQFTQRDGNRVILSTFIKLRFCEGEFVTNFIILI